LFFRAAFAAIVVVFCDCFARIQSNSVGFTRNLMTNPRFDELDIKAKVMLAIWELTKDDGSKFVSPDEVAGYLSVDPGYIRAVLREIESGRLSEKRYHASGKLRGRKRISYRLHDDAVIKEGTALLLVQLLKSHRNHSVNYEEFIELMVQKHEMSREGVVNRIAEGIRVGYIEDLNAVDGTIRGRERINEDFDYIEVLASKYEPTRSRVSGDSASN
jgi:hypothetical protein